MTKEYDEYSENKHESESGRNLLGGLLRLFVTLGCFLAVIAAILGVLRVF